MPSNPDDETIQNNPSLRPELHVPFRLDADGDSILLSAPDGTLVDRVDFGQQSPDKTMGRAADGAPVALADLSPLAANGALAVSPSVTYVVNGDVVEFTVRTEPGFLYQAEASDNLVDWIDLGSPTLATGNTTLFTDALDGSHQYYRFRRTP